MMKTVCWQDTTNKSLLFATWFWWICQQNGFSRTQTTNSEISSWGHTSSGIDWAADATGHPGIPWSG